jgi:hypothetical protein
MSEQSIVLVGGPSSGKSNFLARLWGALLKQEGALIAPSPPDKIEYVESLLRHQLQGKFAPRSDLALENQNHDLTIKVAFKGTVDSPASLIVPDVLGELWKKVVVASEIPHKWFDTLRHADSALLFVRAHNEENHDPLDWATASSLLGAGLGFEGEADAVPTQVALCELIRTLELNLARARRRPRIALVVAAWDTLDPAQRDKSPFEYVASQFPLLAGRLQDDLSVDIQLFGLSIFGGDVGEAEFRDSYLKGGGLASAGYIVATNGESTYRTNDVTLPIQWLLR